jgi:hypothetical protein
MSTQYIGAGTHLANSTITAFRLVVLSSNGGVGLNGDSTKPDGVAQTDAASGDYVGVNYIQNSGTQKGASAVSVIAVGDVLYAGASGQVSTTGTVVVGKAMSASSATGTVVEFLANTL